MPVGASNPFDSSNPPRLVVASLSGQSDAEWVRRASKYADVAFLGGIALDADSRDAARALVARGRSEFLPADPIQFVDDQLTELDETESHAESADPVDPAAPFIAGVNVRSATVDPVAEAAAVCADHGAAIEINAHCRQAELRAVGCGETLLRNTPRLREYVATAAEEGATVSVKVRAEVPGVDLAATARAVADAGADVIHVDTMDSEHVVSDVASVAEETGLFVVANNGVRDRWTTREYFDYGADAVSVGRPSDDPVVMNRVREAVDEWFAVESEATT